MLFDELGLPKEIGATDLQDSSRLAGIMATFGHEKAPFLGAYLVDGKYVRHPKEKIYSMSRDQTVCLFSGMKAQGNERYVDAKYPTEGDLISPSVRDHFYRCAGINRNTSLGNLWLKLDIIWHSKFYPLNEPNQLLCVLAHADVKYLRMWVYKNPKWKESIIEYWNGWRGEPELSELMISKIERRCKTEVNFWIK